MLSEIQLGTKLKEEDKQLPQLLVKFATTVVQFFTKDELSSLLSQSSKALEPSESSSEKKPLAWNDKYQLLITKGECEIALGLFNDARTTLKRLAEVKVSLNEISYWQSLIEYREKLPPIGNQSSLESASQAFENLLKEIDAKCIVGLGELVLNGISSVAKDFYESLPLVSKTQSVTVAMKLDTTLKIKAYLLQAKIYLAMNKMDDANNRIAKANEVIAFEKIKFKGGEFFAQLQDPRAAGAINVAFTKKEQEEFPYCNEESEIIWLHGELLLAKATKKKDFALALDKFIEARKLSCGNNLRQLSLKNEQETKIYSYITSLLNKISDEAKYLGTSDELCKVNVSKIIPSSFFGSSDFTLLKAEVIAKNQHMQASQLFYELNYYYDAARYQYLCGDTIGADKTRKNLKEKIESKEFNELRGLILKSYKDRLAKYIDIAEQEKREKICKVMS